MLTTAAVTVNLLRAPESTEKLIIAICALTTVVVSLLLWSKIEC